ncbi:hypothetical protein [Mycolicibacterium sp. YH-1]|uniref:hypothetical protein n=1 Tax=Mycolicibacterium sp. YH-1 TaxID=2908837 RepID=UPI001F4C2666|nr:hypothetical protein [Mycolicibacterium sp. YH-1]UNB52794.1 hypothetical protein L0M16_34040 [Mycolicibacterium sp. YH-1]
MWFPGRHQAVSLRQTDLGHTSEVERYQAFSRAGGMFEALVSVHSAHLRTPLCVDGTSGGGVTGLKL